jgi:hypothetical protein
MNYETAKEIEIALAKKFNPRVCLILPNVAYGMGFDHEIDLLVISKSGYATEIEIKVDKRDILHHEKQKKHAHGGKKIKFIFFAIPEKLYTEQIIASIPEDAGIIVVYPDGSSEVPRNPKSNPDAEKIPPEDQYHLAGLTMLRYWRLRGLKFGADFSEKWSQGISLPDAIRTGQKFREVGADDDSWMIVRGGWIYSEKGSMFGLPLHLNVKQMSGSYEVEGEGEEEGEEERGDTDSYGSTE